ncbi:unnamed protein product, partial [Vitis vinifera]
MFSATQMLELLIPGQESSEGMMFDRPNK